MAQAGIYKIFAGEGLLQSLKNSLSVILYRTTEYHRNIKLTRIIYKFLPPA